MAGLAYGPWEGIRIAREQLEYCVARAEAGPEEHRTALVEACYGVHVEPSAVPVAELRNLDGAGSAKQQQRGTTNRDAKSVATRPVQPPKDVRVDAPAVLIAGVNALPNAPGGKETRAAVCKEAQRELAQGGSWADEKTPLASSLRTMVEGVNCDEVWSGR